MRERVSWLEKKTKRARKACRSRVKVGLMQFLQQKNKVNFLLSRCLYVKYFNTRMNRRGRVPQKGKRGFLVLLMFIFVVGVGIKE